MSDSAVSFRDETFHSLFGSGIVVDHHIVRIDIVEKAVDQHKRDLALLELEDYIGIMIARHREYDHTVDVLGEPVFDILLFFFMLLRGTLEDQIATESLHSFLDPV